MESSIHWDHLSGSEMIDFEGVYENARVLVTGHTGFKGAWLCTWLDAIGAKVYGISLAPDSSPSLFEDANVSSFVDHRLVDIRDREALQKAVDKIDPEYVFHLAAQSLVRRSYRKPIETFETNIMGTANLLDVCRRSESVKAVICITTDKVYKNEGHQRMFIETDPLGGYDPYSASKAGCELVAESMRNLTEHDECHTAIATARGGNVMVVEIGPKID